MRRKLTLLSAAFLAAACGGSYNVSRTGGSPAGGSAGLGGMGGASGSVAGGNGGTDASPTGGSDATDAFPTGGSGGAAGATTTGPRVGSDGGHTTSTGGSVTSGGARATAVGGAATGGLLASGGVGGNGGFSGGTSTTSPATGGASGTGSITANGGSIGGTSTTSVTTGGASGSGGTAAGLEPCSSSDGSGCGDPAFCLDTRSDACSPDYMSGCTGYCARRRQPAICAGLAQPTPCPDGFTCLPDARTYLGTDSVSLCVGSDTPECAANGACPAGFACVPSTAGSRCSPDRTACEDYVTCKMAQPPPCPPGYARSTPDHCYGPCVPVEACVCSTDTQCGLVGASCDRKQGRCYLAQAPEPRCQLPFDVGTCDAVAPVYAFVDGECKSATYGGCGGNDNRFPTLEECLARCQGMPGDQPCPDGRAERAICLGCATAGGCLRYVTACAKPCATEADCQSTGLSCSGSYCETRFCI